MIRTIVWAVPAAVGAAAYATLNGISPWAILVPCAVAAQSMLMVAAGSSGPGGAVARLDAGEPAVPARGAPAPARPAPGSAGQTLSTNVDRHRAAILVTADPTALKDQIDWLAGRFRDLRIVESLHDLRSSAPRNASDWGVVILDLDGVGDIGLIFDDLRRLRDRACAVPLILMSSQFREDDYGTDRAPLCDASIRKPVSLSTLDTALARAQENNTRWQRRVEERLAPGSAFRTPPQKARRRRRYVRDAQAETATATAAE